ncbi:type IV secretory system conjugative DNA transfer family protein [Venenivibrio stagnispumantis]
MSFGIDDEEKQTDFIKVDDGDLSTHMHVLGATGSGKTVFLSYLDAQAIYNDYSLIKLDMKFDEQNFKLCYGLAYHWNKPFYFLNLASHTGSNAGLSSFGTHSYNPLETGDELSITAKIMQATKSSDAVSYYEEVKETSVKAFVSAFLSTGKKWTFRDWYATLIDYEIMLDLINQTKNEMAKSYLYNLYDRLNDDKKRMQAEKDISGLRNFVAKMSDYDFLNSYVSDINLEKLIFANAVVYIVLPKLLFGEVAKSLGKMIASDLQYITGYLATRMQKTKIILSIDEFENFVFEGIQDLFNKGRSAGIRVIASHQSLSDIAHEEKETMKRIIQANTRIKVFLSQADTESAEWFSSLVGKREVKASINL